MIRYIISKNASLCEYSVEAGKADNAKHFDHHKPEHRHFPAPCNNHAIQPIEHEGKVVLVGITHMDADTFSGIKKLENHEESKVLDYQLMEQIDLNGTSICPDPFNPTRLYMTGLYLTTREMKFPSATEELQDVTNKVKTLLNTTTEEYIEIGRKAHEQSELNYTNHVVSSEGKMGLWSPEKQTYFDPSRPYKDSTEVVVVFNQDTGGIGIFADPKSEYTDFAFKTWGDVYFAGHPKACGSPWDQICTLEDAVKVYEDIKKRMQ